MKTIASEPIALPEPEFLRRVETITNSVEILRYENMKAEIAEPVVPIEGLEGTERWARRLQRREFAVEPSVLNVSKSIVQEKTVSKTVPERTPMTDVSPKKDFETNISDPAFLLVKDLTKSYTKGKLKIPVLKGVDFSVREGEFVSIVGQSGSGKSTLLHLLGTLDTADSGTIQFEGRRIEKLSMAKRDFLRNRSIGFIFQFYHLLPELTTLENVLSPLMIRESVLGYLFRRRQHIEKAKRILDLVGLSHRLKHKPSELSGGEMQRAAIARALIAEPKILLADEPTGNLDAASAREIIELLRRLNAETNLTILMVTHDNLIARCADRIVRMIDGKIVVDIPETTILAF